jgi:hypothetical protein
MYVFLLAGGIAESPDPEDAEAVRSEKGNKFTSYFNYFAKSASDEQVAFDFELEASCSRATGELSFRIRQNRK